MRRLGLAAALLLPGCTARQPRPVYDAGPSEGLTAAPPPVTFDAPPERPQVACPVTDKSDLDGALDEAAHRFERGDAATALACAEQAARVAPRSVEAHHDRADALVALERMDEARSAYVLALALDPEDSQTLASAADFYINRLAGEHEQLLIGLEYARRGSAHVGRRREDRELAARLALLEAEALDDLARSDEALPRVEAALRAIPSDAKEGKGGNDGKDGKDGKDEKYGKGGNDGKEGKEGRKTGDRDGDNYSADARFQRALILFHLCKLDRARQAFEDILAKHPDDAFAHHHLGLILERAAASDPRVGVQAETHLSRARALAPAQFPPPILPSAVEFEGMVQAAIARFDPATKNLLATVRLEITDLPAMDDLLANDPPFPPTILGLFRDDEGAPGNTARGSNPVQKSIVLYRKNLARAAATGAELEKQVRITLLHELGHLTGADEDELRARGFE